MDGSPTTTRECDRAAGWIERRHERGHGTPASARWLRRCNQLFRPPAWRPLPLAPRSCSCPLAPLSAAVPSHAPIPIPAGPHAAAGRCAHARRQAGAVALRASRRRSREAKRDRLALAGVLLLVPDRCPMPGPSIGRLAACHCNDHSGTVRVHRPTTVMRPSNQGVVGEKNLGFGTVHVSLLLYK